MKILLIRHAEPDYEQDSLTEKGFREAELLARRAADWKVDAVYVSPLGRAQATAVPLLKALHREGVTLDWLREFEGRIRPRYGTYQGIPWDFPPSLWTKFDTLYDTEKWNMNPPMEAPEAGRSVREVYETTCRELDGLLAGYGYLRSGKLYAFRRHSDAVVVCVCHMGITFAMLSHLLGIPFVPLIQGFFLPASSVTILGTEEVEPGIAAFRCQCLGDTRHLQAGREPISPAGYFDGVFQG